MNSSLEKIRIDKWLWAMRFFKSRSLAAEACDKGRIRIAEQPVKASRNTRTGEIVSVRKGSFTRQFEILQLTENRIPAKSISAYYKEVTPHEELEKIKLYSISTDSHHHRGEGRPTKKDRRDLEEFLDF